MSTINKPHNISALHAKECVAFIDLNYLPAVEFYLLPEPNCREIYEVKFYKTFGISVMVGFMKKLHF